jgi:hypothetical protein
MGLGARAAAEEFNRTPAEEKSTFPGSFYAKVKFLPKVS